MSKSLIQTANTLAQEVAVNGIISPGAVIRRFGCNLALNNTNIVARGAGYFTITGAVTVTPTEAGDVQIGVYVNGVQVPGAVAKGTVSAVGNSITLPLVTTIRKNCCGDDDEISIILIEGASTVDNVSLRVEKV